MSTDHVRVQRSYLYVTPKRQGVGVIVLGVIAVLGGVWSLIADSLFALGFPYGANGPFSDMGPTAVLFAGVLWMVAAGMFVLGVLSLRTGDRLIEVGEHQVVVPNGELGNRMVTLHPTQIRALRTRRGKFGWMVRITYDGGEVGLMERQFKPQSDFTAFLTDIQSLSGVQAKRRWL